MLLRNFLGGDMPRTRSYDGKVNTSCRCLKKAGTRVISDVYRTCIVSRSGEDKTTIDDLHPGWKKSISSGNIVLGNFSMSKYTRIPGDGATFLAVDSSLNPPWTYEITGDVAAYIDAAVATDGQSWYNDLQNMKPAVLTEAYAKIRNDSIMSGEIMASLGQTLRMLRRPFGSTVQLLKRCFKDARRSYRKTAKSVAQANADAWLEYRYGMKPLFLDIKQGMKMHSEAEIRLQAARKVVRASAEYSKNWQYNFVDVPFTLEYACKGTGTIDQSVKGHVDAGVIYSVSGRTQAQQLAEDLRLGIDSVPATAWELIPLSFVADWFVLVGPWLEAMNLPPSVSVLGNWVTMKYALTTRNRGTSMSMWFNGNKTGNYGSSSRYWDHVSRSVNQPLPTYPPRDYRLAGMLHATDGLALLTKPILSLCDKLKH